tara:strand:- start:90 stop:614 length:525 start_codon:yes stop_codon:yes gene_type:complete
MPTVEELKDELRKKGLKVSGNKDELIDRLEEYYDVPDNVRNKKLYRKCRQAVKERVKTWPSAYASGQVVQEYKDAGGKYSGKKDSSDGIDRWFEEKWVNVCKKTKGGNYKKCGRKSDSNAKYPYCRPTIRVSKDTPKTVSEIKKDKGKDKLKKMCEKKRSKGKPKNGKSQRVSR